jgi:hypothetical protein
MRISWLDLRDARDDLNDDYLIETLRCNRSFFI